MTSLSDSTSTSANSLNTVIGTTTPNNFIDSHQQQNNTENHLPQAIMASPSQNSPMTSLNINSSNQQQNNSNSASNNTSTSTNNLRNNSETQNLPILTKPRLQELVREVDPTEQLDEEVEELLLQIADDFVDDAIKSACLFAKHRKVSKVEVKDVQLHLERKWNMWIPGFGTDELRPYKRATVTEAHKQRLALIRKTIKKY